MAFKPHFQNHVPKRPLSIAPPLGTSETLKISKFFTQGKKNFFCSFCIFWMFHAILSTFGTDPPPVIENFLSPTTTMHVNTPFRTLYGLVTYKNPF